MVCGNNIKVEGIVFLVVHIVLQLYSVVLYILLVSVRGHEGKHVYFSRGATKYALEKLHAEIEEDEKATMERFSEEGSDIFFSGVALDDISKSKRDMVQEAYDKIVKECDEDTYNGRSVLLRRFGTELSSAMRRSSVTYISIIISNIVIFVPMFAIAGKLEGCLSPGWVSIFIAIAILSSAVTAMNICLYIFYVIHTNNTAALDALMSEISLLPFLMRAESGSMLITRSSRSGSNNTSDADTIDIPIELMHHEQLNVRDAHNRIKDSTLSRMNARTMEVMRSDRTSCLDVSNKMPSNVSSVVGGNMTAVIVVFITLVCVPSDNNQLSDNFLTGAMALVVATIWYSISGAIDLVNCALWYRSAAMKQALVNLKFEAEDTAGHVIIRAIKAVGRAPPVAALAVTDVLFNLARGRDDKTSSGEGPPISDVFSEDATKRVTPMGAIAIAKHKRTRSNLATTNDNEDEEV